MGMGMMAPICLKREETQGCGMYDVVDLYMDGLQYKTLN